MSAQPIEPRPGSVVPDATTNHQARNGWLYVVARVVLTPFLFGFFRPSVTGKKNIPRRGPAIIASNHTSYLDWLLMPATIFTRRISFLAKLEYFTGTSVRGRMQNFFFTGTGQVPVDRAGSDSASAALRVAVELLVEGRLVGVFPEGTRTRDGRLNRGRTGVARMAAASGVPVIPTAVVGLFEVAPPGARIPRPLKCSVHFGAPMPPVCPQGETPTAERLREWTDELMLRIAGMSGQEQSGVNAIQGPS